MLTWNTIDGLLPNPMHIMEQKAANEPFLIPG